MSKHKKDPTIVKSFVGNKKEGQGFADKRKRKAAYEYLKLLKKEKQTAERVEGKEAPKHQKLSFLQHRNTKEKQNHTFSVAEKIARRKKEEREKKQQEIERTNKEKESALASYKDRKKQQHLKLCKRTSKGQPVMRFQMEVLLDKIQKQKEHS
ncbi:unnamed protein product [Candidula unifasciata]|uniref:Thyroid transcription factor 1-associated protein 26 n=1 Tax=Candidula unifasciata TaxID=100452 RepID=A0A8S3YLD0_9EUPU|nr:unnamed protein product [Candidula unifasciata]